MANKGDRKFEIFKLANYEPIEIRFNSNTSTFYADFLGKRFGNADINKLKSEITDEARIRESTMWKPVIVIKTGEWQWNRNISGIEIERKFLGTTIYPGGITKQYLADVNYKDVFKDNLDVKNWIPAYSHSEWKGETEGNKLIDFTRERYETLKFIESKMREFKLRLVEVISGSTGAEFLDLLTENKSLFLQYEFTKKRLLPAQKERA